MTKTTTTAKKTMHDNDNDDDNDDDFICFFYVHFHSLPNVVVRLFNNRIPLLVDTSYVITCTMGTVYFIDSTKRQSFRQ